MALRRQTACSNALRSALELGVVRGLRTTGLAPSMVDQKRSRRRGPMIASRVKRRSASLAAIGFAVQFRSGRVSRREQVYFTLSLVHSSQTMLRMR